MAKRRRRNAPITKTQANALRAILAAHGYRVRKVKRRKVKSRRAKRTNPVKARKKLRAPKRLRSGSVFKRRGRKYRVIAFTKRIGRRSIRVRFVRKA